MRHLRYRLLAPLAVAAVALTAAGCADDATKTSTSTAAGGGARTKPADQVVVGFAGPNLINNFFVGMAKGVRDAAKAKGFKLIETNANNDAATQFNDSTDLLNRGIDGLIVTPIDQNGIVPAVQQANSKGVPVFTLDRGAKGGTVTSKVETDNVKAGRDGAEWVAQQLQKRYGSPKGTVADLQGVVGTSAAADRESGFQEGIKKYPGIKVVANQAADFDQEKALNVTTNILQANPKLDAIFGANDDMTVGAVKAIDQSGRFKPIGDPGHILIIGIDGNAQGLEAIRAGKQDATISQNPVKMASQAVEFIYQKVVLGKDVPATYYWPTIMLTKDDLDSPQVKEYGLWAEEVK